MQNDLIIPEWFPHWFDSLPELSSPMELQRKLNVKKDIIYRSIYRCDLDAMRLGGLWKIPRPALAEWFIKNLEINR